jgi:hypothetical protein
MKNLYMPSAPTDLIISQAAETCQDVKQRRVKLTEIKDQDTSDKAFENLLSKI